MESEHADRRMRAYAALEGLRQTLPTVDPQGGMKGQVSPVSIQQYEGALDQLEACGEDVRQYRLGEAPRGGPRTSVPAPELLGRVMAVLGYFTLRDAVQNQASATGAALKTLIGFDVPKQ